MLAPESIQVVLGWLNVLPGVDYVAQSLTSTLFTSIFGKNIHTPQTLFIHKSPSPPPHAEMSRICKLELV